MQIKITQIHFSPTRLAKIQTADTSCGEDCEEIGTFIYCWWECDWHGPFLGAIWQDLQRLQMHIPFDPAILLLGVSPTYIIAHIQQATCARLFTATLFVTAKDQKQLKSPSTQ